MLCDLDGVVWLAHEPIPGAPEAIARLRAEGFVVLFVTNNSGDTIAAQEAALAKIGVPAEGAVLTSSMAAAQLLQPDEHVLVVGGPGIVEAVEERGATAVMAAATDASSNGRYDAVMVGIDRQFTYETLRRAADGIHRGARLIGTNDDATYPTPMGPIPGGGAILAAVATAAGVQPVIAGKPHRPMAALVEERFGADAARAAVVVGDRPSTDGLFARQLRCRFALVLSGVTASAAGVDPAPDLVGVDLAAIATTLSGHG